MALAAGVRVGFGSDLIGKADAAQARELLLRAEVQSPLDVLRSATQVNADLLGRPGELGVVAPGAYGDLSQSIRVGQVTHPACPRRRGAGSLSR